MRKLLLAALFCVSSALVQAQTIAIPDGELIDPFTNLALPLIRSEPLANGETPGVICGDGLNCSTTVTPLHLTKAKPSTQWDEYSPDGLAHKVVAKVWTDDEGYINLQIGDDVVAIVRDGKLYTEIGKQPGDVLVKLLQVIAK